MSSIGGEVTYNTESLDNILAVATKLADFQEDELQGVEGFMNWLDKISSNIGTFGINASTFIKNMDLAMSALGENGGQYNTARLGSIISFAGDLNDLQKALPDDTLFDGKMDLTKFSKYIKKFAEAIGEFGSQTGEINLGQMNLAITAAYRLKYLINALTDLDDSGVKIFAGGFGSKGAAVKIAETMATFGETIGEINTDKMSVAVSSATRLKNLINGLAGIDTSGIDKFKVDAIATEMEGYANKVAEIDTATVSSSITSANRLKKFVADLAELDSSGVSNFKIGSIGQSLATYSSNVSGFNGSQANASIASAIKLKNFISSLSGLNTSGIGAFKSAVDELSTVNVGAVVEAFSGASESMTTIGMNLITALSNGMLSGSVAIKSTTDLVVSAMSNSVKSKSSLLTSAGNTLARNLASGISSNRSVVSYAASSAASSGAQGARGAYTSMYSAGSYLMDGLKKGINDRKWVAINAAKEVAQQITKTTMGVFAEKSPSRVFMQIGRYLDEGLSIGINNNSDAATSSAYNMANSVIENVQKAISIAGDLFSSNADVQPTIRPVVDLSNVQTGVNAINGLFNTAQSVRVQANLNAIGHSMNAMRQNGKNDDVISAINKLNDKLDGVGNTYNTINGVTYDDGSNVTDAIETLVRYAKIGGRV